MYSCITDFVGVDAYDNCLDESDVDIIHVYIYIYIYGERGACAYRVLNYYEL